jgi:hypothetical protein
MAYYSFREFSSKMFLEFALFPYHTYKPLLNDEKFNPAANAPRQSEAPGAGADEVEDCASEETGITGIRITAQPGQIIAPPPDVSFTPHQSRSSIAWIL